MVVQPTLTVRHEQPYRRALRRAASFGLHTELRGALRDIGEEIVVESQNLVPFLEGDLHDSIRSYVAGDSVFVEAGSGAPQEYAEVIYWGWPEHGIEESRFIGEAIGEKWGDIIRRVEDVADDVGRTFSTF